LNKIKYKINMEESKVTINDLIEYLSKLDKQQEIFLDKFNWRRRPQSKKDQLNKLIGNLTNKKISGGVEFVHTNELKNNTYKNSDDEIKEFINNNPRFGVLSESVYTIKEAYDRIKVDEGNTILAVVASDRANIGTSRQNHEILHLSMFDTDTIIEYFKESLFNLILKPCMEDLRQINLSMIEDAQFIREEAVSMVFKSYGGINIDLYQGRALY